MLHSSLLILLLPLSLVASTPEEPSDIDVLLPVENRPDDFSDAVGRFALVTMTAEPTQVQVEQPLTLKIRITAATLVLRPPERPDLRQLPEFSEAFYIEDEAEPASDQQDPRTWEFVYTLKPRNGEVNAIPAFAFHYFNSDFLPPGPHTEESDLPGMPASSKGYQTRYAEEIPLIVKPLHSANCIKASAEPPGSVYYLADVQLHGAPALPLWPFIVLAIMLPPVACTAWYMVWRRRYPDAAANARRRRSWAGKLALQALQSLHKPDAKAKETASPSLAHQACVGTRETREQAESVVRIVMDYLHQRFDLTHCSEDGLEIHPTEPTPAETRIILAQAGLSNELVEKTATFLRLCDSIRFAPHDVSRTELIPFYIDESVDRSAFTQDPVHSARQIIHALEAETC